ncbi:MAG: hypothetical protein FWD47_12300 [Treponema sp.]|nr:hypothetical protein [Treponema sp.]
MNASVFDHSSVFYNHEFENILIGIINCYKLIITCKVVLPNDENEIRNKIVGDDYLNNNQVRKKLGIIDYIFEPEAPEKTGRVDIKIISRQSTFIDTKAYYIIECKRLDNKNTTGTTGLNAKYINDGIARFASEKYSMYGNTAGMIGFVVEEMDIHQNILDIRTLLNQHFFAHVSTEEAFAHKTIVTDFKFSYYSIHKIDGVSKIIYHLMFDFSNNIAV